MTKSNCWWVLDRLFVLLIGTCLLLFLRGDSGGVAAQSLPDAAARESARQEAEKLMTESRPLFEKGRYDEALPLVERAVALREQALGPEDPLLATPLHNLAELYSRKGNYAKAEPLFLRALAIREKALGPEHPDVALSLNNLAGLYVDQGRYAPAEPLHQRALQIREKALGKDNLDVAQSLNNMAVLYEAKGDAARAIELRARSTEISEYHLRLNFETGSERQRLAYFDMLRSETNAVVALNVNAAPDHAAALRLSLLTVLRRKGRTLDATADSLSALRARLNQADRALLDQFVEARSHLAMLWLNGPGRSTPAQHQAAIKSAEELREKLESKISQRSAAFRAQAQPVTLEAVQAALPRDAALIEFVAFKPTTGKRDQTHYAAYVLRPQGAPQLVKLGEAQAIDQAVAAVRAALCDPQRTGIKRLARALDEKVMQPVRAALGDAQHLLLAPDGQLNLVPFAALVDEQGRWLVARYTITYLTSGRDLLRWQTPSESRSAPLIVAAPDFGAPALLAEQQEKPSSKNSSDLMAKRAQADYAQVFFGPLPGAVSEVRELRQLLPQATFLTGEQATETALKHVSGPRLLHIATHGFFLGEDVPAPSDTRAPADTTRLGKWIARVPDPLLRSGLALAGANQGKSGPHGEDDGVLTALEAAGLDLWGTKLVVLSACDTGVGEVKNGDGVYGLRRALVLAGAESQMMSLWPVPDRGTRELMSGYYRGLQQGQGRSEALRQVQLQMLKSKTQSHPYYWASFIQSGEWANLEGNR